jgi:hypothetical protein
MKFNRKRKANFSSNSYVYYILMGTLFLTSCRSKAPITQQLFMQTAGARVELPEGAKDNSLSVSENISMRDSIIVDNVSSNDSLGDGIWKSVKLGEVDVVAQRRRIQQVKEHNGEVTIMFYIKANRTLFDNRWQLMLTPELIENDSSTLLNPVLWQGTEFKQIQDQQYADYAAFLQGIIPQSKYDSTFLDRSGILRDIKEQQKMYFQVYESERKKHLAFIKWKNTMENRHGYVNMKAAGNRNTLKQNMQRNSYKKSINAFIQKHDTLGIRNSYSKKYERRIKFWPMYRDQKVMTAKDVPSDFRQLWSSNSRIEDIRNYNFTSRDSMEITSNRFFRKEIAANEYNRDNADLIRSHMIRFPKRDSVTIVGRPDSVSDFSHLYMQKIRVKEGVRKIRLTLRGQVLAKDYSTWNIPANDTLTFVIASVADLVDTTLGNHFKLNNDSLGTPASDPYNKGIQALQNRQYEIGYSLLKEFSDYNTAIALTCLKEYAAAEQLLKQQPQTAAVKYLRAIVNTHLEDDELAVELLLEACKADSKYTYRRNIDTDIVELVSKFMGLELELNRIAAES